MPTSGAAMLPVMPSLSYSRPVRMAVMVRGSASGSLSLLSSPLAEDADVEVLAGIAAISSAGVGASLMPPTSMMVMAALEFVMPSLTDHAMVRSVVLGLIKLVFS